MSNADGEARNLSTWRMFSRRHGPVAWLVGAFLFADFLAVADSLWWHWLDASPDSAPWRRLNYFFSGAGELDASSIDVVRLALASSQASLFVLWACFGRRKWALRWAATAVGIGYCITVLVANAATAHYPTKAELLFFCQAATIVILALGLRIAGWRLSSTASNESGDGARRRIQFAMQDLIAGTAIIAALLWLFPNLLLQQTFDELRAAANYAGAAFWSGDPRPKLVWMATSGIVSGAVAMLGIWFLLRAGKLWLQLTAFLVASWAMARIAILARHDFEIYVQRFVHVYTESDRTTPYIAWLCLQAVMLAAALVVLRCDGRRLSVRESSRTSPGPAKRPTRKAKLRRVLAGGAYALLLASAVLFDEVVSRIAGDHEVRRTAKAINCGYGERVSAFCSWRDFNWTQKQPPYVGAQLRLPVDATVVAQLREDHAPEGLWLEGEISAEIWREVLRSPNLKYIIVRANGDASRLTDSQLMQLTSLPSLRRLDIAGSEISDEGLMHLAALPDLELVRLSFSRVTDAGEEKFRRTRPDVLVFCERSP